MRVSYNKLWKILINKETKKSGLRDKASINFVSIAELGKGKKYDIYTSANI